MALECRKDGIPTCMWGTCLNSTFCSCEEGYIHDAILMKYENCGLSVTGLNTYGGLVLAFCILAGMLNLYVGKSTLKGSLLRRLAIAAVATNVSFSAVLADLLIYRQVTTQAIIF